MGLRIVFDARILARELPMTGIPRYLIRLLEALHTHPEMERPVLVTDRELVQPAYDLGAVEVLPRGVAWQQGILTGWLKRHRTRFDLLHNPAYATPLIHVLPTVTTVFDLCFKRYPALVKPDVRRHLARSLWVTTRRSDAILVTTEDMRQEMISFYPRSQFRLHVTRLAGGLEDTLPQEPDGVQKPFFLWVGTRGPRKNLGPAIEAMGAFPNAQLVVVGSPDSDEECQRVLDRDSRVIYTGFIPDDNLRWLYRHAVALIFSSVYEGFGMPIVEAMQEGCPVVCGEVPGVREIARGACIFVDITSAESLADGMKTAMGAGWGEKGKIAARDYSWAKTAAATVQVYKGVLASA